MTHILAAKEGQTRKFFVWFSGKYGNMGRSHECTVDHHGIWKGEDGVYIDTPEPERIGQEIFDVAPIPLPLPGEPCSNTGAASNQGEVWPKPEPLGLMAKIAYKTMGVCLGLLSTCIVIAVVIRLFNDAAKVLV